MISDVNSLCLKVEKLKPCNSHCRRYKLFESEVLPMSLQFCLQVESDAVRMCKVTRNPPGCAVKLEI